MLNKCSNRKLCNGRYLLRDNNVAIGYNAGTAITSGINNTLIGYQAGDVITDFLENVIIGYNADPSGGSGTSNEIVIGYNATGRGSNMVVW